MLQRITAWVGAGFLFLRAGPSCDIDEQWRGGLPCNLTQCKLAKGNQERRDGRSECEAASSRGSMGE